MELHRLIALIALAEKSKTSGIFIKKRKKEIG
jgi:hypothetical protein